MGTKHVMTISISRKVMIEFVYLTIYSTSFQPYSEIGVIRDLLKDSAGPVNHDKLSSLLAKLDHLETCCGQPDEH